MLGCFTKIYKIKENVENFNSNLRALEFPVIDAVRIDEIPPAQTDQQPARDVLHCPEVHRQQCQLEKGISKNRV